MDRFTCVNLWFVFNDEGVKMFVIHDISEVIWKMTDFSTIEEMKSGIIQFPFGRIEKLDEYVKKMIKILKEKKIEHKTIDDLVRDFWDYSAYFFLCHIYTELKLNDLSKERNWLKIKFCEFFTLLKKSKSFNDNWIYWQYAQVPASEFNKLEGKWLPLEDSRLEEELNKICKIAVEKFDPTADYDKRKCNPRFAKATPLEKSTWLDNRLKALKKFIETGECDDMYFAYVLYLLLKERDLGMPKSNRFDAYEYDAIIILASFAAHIDNKEKLFSNVDNYLIDYFYWYVRLEMPWGKELDSNSSLNVSQRIFHSCAHMNYDGDFYTIIRKNEELNSWIQLMCFFKLITLDEALIVLRCFGFLRVPKDITDSEYFTRYFKKAILQEPNYLKARPGFTFCLYWMIHLMNEHDFNKVFQDQVKTSTSVDYCVENGLIPIKESYTKNALKVLQMFLFFALIDLSTKFKTETKEKKNLLALLMETIKDGTWYNEDVLLKVYKHLGQKINLKGEITKISNDFPNNEKTIKSMVLLVFNLSKFLRDNDIRCLVDEVNYIKELQRENLHIPEHSKLRRDQNDGNLADTEVTKILKAQEKLREIDSGFKILSFKQKIPSFQNLVSCRELTVKIFTDSDLNTLDSGNDKYFRNLYSNLVHTKYAYLERNMTIHYATLSKVEDLFESRNFPDMLTALYDLTHNELGLHWLAVKEKSFDEKPYNVYQNFLVECLGTMETFVLNEKRDCGDSIFDDNGELSFKKSYLRKLGEKFWESRLIQKDELRECLNVLYCNSDLMNDLPEYETDVKPYSTNFWNAYKYEMAVYLIKVTVELTALYK